MRAQFIAYRALPFLVLIAFDAGIFALPAELGPGTPVVIGGYFLMPFVILLGSGYIVRQLQPQSVFSLWMLSLSVLVATAHPLLSLVVASKLGLFEW